jgi:hypothetical protein
MLDWNALERSTRLLVYHLHHAALLFMVAAYALKIRQLLARPLAEEGTPARGNHARAIRYSYALLATPWRMESQRRHWYRYVEFALLHLCVVAAIGVAFALPWLHALLAAPGAVLALKVAFGLGTVLGLSRLTRRVVEPVVRAVSSPDDYACILLVTLWMASGSMAAAQQSESWLFAYYALATLLLCYVPFSKMSHYLYWFFVRYYVGKHFGHRGVFPVRRPVMNFQS